MTPDELLAQTSAEALLEQYDIKTLMLDWLRSQQDEAIVALFKTYVQDVSEEKLNHYKYMQRQ